MSKITIYHNPRCSKSRETLSLLETQQAEFNVVKYLEDSLTAEELRHIISLLKISPLELVRKQESIWKENFQDKSLSDEELIEIMISHPKLIERPIVINGNQAVIGRPPIKVLDIL